MADNASITLSIIEAKSIYAGMIEHFGSRKFKSLKKYAVAPIPATGTVVSDYESRQMIFIAQIMGTLGNRSLHVTLGDRLL